jgi:diguanylate cyclase (GGDEF)-like protein
MRSKPRREAISGLLASQLVLGLLVAITTLLLVLESRQQALTASRHEIQSLALTLADQADRTFEAVDLLQTTFMEMVRPDRWETPEDYRRQMSGAEINQLLVTNGKMLPQLDTVALVDADGLFINFNHALPVPTNSVADRSYFQALKTGSAKTVIISEPIENRLDQAIAVVVAHRITATNGDFLGISFAGVRMSYFDALYKTVTNKEDTAIALTRKDGVLFARYPQIAGSVGKSFMQAGIVAQMAKSGAISAVIQKASQIDGTERLIAGHTLSHFPLVVSVSSSVSAILRPWREQAAYLIGSAATMELLVFGVGVLMQRQLRSQRLLGEARSKMAEAETARRADQELQIQAVRFSAALGNMSEVLCLFDAADRLVLGNDRLAVMLGMSPGSITTGMTIHEMGVLLAKTSPLPSAIPQQIHRLIKHMRAAGRRASKALDIADGRRIAVNYARMEDDGWLVTMEDMTEQRRTAERIEHMAHHDALTGLANRLLFTIKLGEAVARCGRNESFAVLYMDLDHFKAVNDTLGHPTGDALLQEVTERLKRVVRTTDTVARLGGDEFAIVQSIKQPSDSTALAQRLIEAVGAPYDVDGNRVIIGTSIGIALVPDDGDDANEIVKNADMALYRSKADGRGRYQFFEKQMNAHMQARRTLDLDLRKALIEGEFRVFYQPLVKIATRTVCGFEALVRWQHPERGMVPPAEFIPMAEETGLIIPLGKWVLRQACADAAQWPDGLKVAVNLSPVQFGSPTLVADVAAALADSGLPPRCLELEITETAMLADTDAVLAILHQLRDLGLRIALDDFGTGYSSLSYLQRFPFNKVKIDRSFVMKLDQGAGDSETIVSAVVDLCTRLGMSTTGEGVETAAQLQRLASLNCVEAQGYLFSRPRPANEVAGLLLKLAPQELSPRELAEIAG